MCFQCVQLHVLQRTSRSKRKEWRQTSKSSHSSFTREVNGSQPCLPLTSTRRFSRVRSCPTSSQVSNNFAKVIAPDGRCQGLMMIFKSVRFENRSKMLKTFHCEMGIW